jgi:hypothetical protein
MICEDSRGTARKSDQASGATHPKVLLLVAEADLGLVEELSHGHGLTLADLDGDELQ